MRFLAFVRERCPFRPVRLLFSLFSSPAPATAPAPATPTSYPGRVQRNVHNVTGFLSWLLARLGRVRSAQDTGSVALAAAATAAISLENFSTTFGQLPRILPRPFAANPAELFVCRAVSPTAAVVCGKLSCCH